MTRTKMRMMEPMVVIGSIILLIAAITAIWKFYTPDSTAQNNDSANLPAYSSLTSTPTGQVAVTTKAMVAFPQYVVTNFDAYKTQDPTQAITTSSGQAVARLESLPTGFNQVSVMFPDTSATPGVSGLTPLASVYYKGTIGQILVNTIKLDLNSSQAYSLGSQQMILSTGETVGYDTNLAGQLANRYILQRNNLYILIYTDLQMEQVKSILGDITLN